MNPVILLSTGIICTW